MQPTLEEEQWRQQQRRSTGYCHDCNFWICVHVEDEDQSCQCPDCNCECPDCSGLDCDCVGLYYYVTQRRIFFVLFKPKNFKNNLYFKTSNQVIQVIEESLYFGNYAMSTED